MAEQSLRGKVCKKLVEKASYVEWNNNERKEYLAVFAKSFRKRVDEFESRIVFCFNLMNLEKTYGTREFHLRKKFKYLTGIILMRYKI